MECNKCDKELRDVTEENPCEHCPYVHVPLSDTEELNFDDDYRREYEPELGARDA